jgi:2-polyprenyl-3-methyl-5-hydroxy-6-metoxy-1,4-benzoquinol methylase
VASGKNQVEGAMCNVKERLDPWAEDINGIQAFLHIQRYEYAMKEANGTVLDVGCGLGYGSKMLHKVDSSVVALDVSNEALSYARRKYDGPTYVKADAQTLPFKNASFDSVTAFEVIEHVNSGVRLLREIHRVLKDEGILKVSTPNTSHLRNRFNRLVFPKKILDNPTNPYHKHEYSFKELATLLNSTGFAIEQKRGQIVTFPLVHKLPPRLSVNTGRNLPRFSYHVIYKARKKTVDH